MTTRVGISEDLSARWQLFCFDRTVDGKQGAPSVAGSGVAFAITQFHRAADDSLSPWSVGSDR
jgi:hypothetical protein